MFGIGQRDRTRSCHPSFVIPGLIFPLAASLLALPPDQPSLADAQSLFYNAQYEAAAALTLVRRTPDTRDWRTTSCALPRSGNTI